ncbi:leucine-rich repeat domain-containing protein [Roseofilum reptotaenium CS-1145]|uniref:Disease resistance R13L4/SHOC-2-like LRR domain-containing protein n=1 Tax=Roseofilum reptotaenium AO1-A TaxID=1925591 RepID=A0A1L9QK14_9CYAN|nr:leucine-rich repeat domain-containing protein [Roseofilum reptotaenium]MDB9515576.1 leucine-rich repeat domain-containing protein [Roseofilum reptotaenium CS-1145]OJJ15741.1 hypothetical protein BI308_24145 [Roseofilum reptotaenium AO1-A]
MDTNEAYRIAQERIAAAQQEKATELDLSNLGLTEVPEAIAQLTNLQTLCLDKNQVSHLPEAIAQLSNLQQLKLHHNQLSHLPEEIAQLTNLRELNLSDNQLSHLVEEIGQLTNLQRLYLHHNQLSHLPVETGFFDRPEAISIKVKLTLWCEHSRQPLPKINAQYSQNPKDQEKGVYILEFPREWLARATPYLTAVTRTVGLIVPVVSSAGKFLMDDIYNEMPKEWLFAQKSIEASMKAGEMALDSASQGNDPGLERGRAINSHGPILRQLHSFLKEKDPTFGSLVRVQDRQQKYFWVHKKYVDEY